MEEELAKPDDLQHLELEINEVSERHPLDLERLYTFHAEEYYDECVDRYLSKDDTQVLVEGENNATAVASYNKLEARMSIKIFTRLTLPQSRSSTKIPAHRMTSSVSGKPTWRSCGIPTFDISFRSIKSAPRWKPQSDSRSSG
jgi:hypothetical protein